jgi:ribosomal protein S18 acetylase RimI-like enzyme
MTGAMTATPITVRDAGPVDLAEVSALLRDAYAEYFDVPAEGPASEYLAEIGDVWSRLGSSELIVAEEAARLAGAVTFFPDAKGYGDRWPEGWSAIRLLGVRPDMRGRGIGRMLTQECLRRARALGAPAVGLYTTDVMAVAKAMYQRMGFGRVPEFDFRPGPTVHVIAYKLDL